MRLGWKEIIWVLFAFLVILLSGFVTKQEESYVIKEVLFHVNGEGDVLMADQVEIKSALYAQMDSLDQKTYAEVDLSEVEYVIEQLSYVANAEAYINRQGNMHIDVLLKEPIVRVFPNSGRGYYIARDGSTIEWMSKRTPRLLIVTGDLMLPNPQDSLKNIAFQKQNKTIHKVASSLASRSFLHSIVDEIRYLDVEHIEFVTNIGEARVIVGSTDNLEKKFDKLTLFYKEAYPKIGLDSYKRIDLRFEGKVYAKKK